MSDKDRTREQRTVVLLAELVVSPPEQVRVWLEKRATRLDTSTLKTDEEALERALLDREDPFIDLSLAQFAAFSETLEPLFARKGPQNKALRLAVLMNEVTGRASFSGIPTALAGPTDAINQFVA